MYLSTLEFYIGLQGNKIAKDYIAIAKSAEKLGYNRLYLYDDLFYHPSFPVLSTMAMATKKLIIGPCLVNGFYRHPAIIASSYSYLYELSGGRAILGLGRGAFYDMLKMPVNEEHTRTAYTETIQLVKHFLALEKKEFRGRHFSTIKEGGLKISPPTNPYLVSATWNYNMAYEAGKYSNELQIAEVWNEKLMGELYYAFIEGNKENKELIKPKFSIGGMVCVANNEREALEKAKPTVAVYLPYLQTILKGHQFDLDSPLLNKIISLSKSGDIIGAAKLMTDDLTRALSMVGTPDQVAERINNLRRIYPIAGLLFSPPYSTALSLIQNLTYLKNELFYRLNGN